MKTRKPGPPFPDVFVKNIPCTSKPTSTSIMKAVHKSPKTDGRMTNKDIPKYLHNTAFSKVFSLFFSSIRTISYKVLIKYKTCFCDFR